MSMQKNDLDAFLRRRLDQAPSALPAGMLGEILKAREKKKRRIFWWLSIMMIACAVTGAAWWTSRTITDLPATATPVSRADVQEPALPANPSSPALLADEQSQPEKAAPAADIPADRKLEDNKVYTDIPVSEKITPQPPPPSPGAGISEGPGLGTMPVKSGEGIQRESGVIPAPAPDAPEPARNWLSLKPFGIRLLPAQFIKSMFSALALRPVNAGKGKSDKPPGSSDSGISFRLGAGLLVVDERFDATVQSDRQAYVPRFLPGIINQGLETRSGLGFQMNAEWCYKHLWWGAAVQLKKTTLSGTYEYLLDSMPVKDAEGRITGYTALPMPLFISGTLGFGNSDTAGHQASRSVLSMYIPIQAGYRGNFGPVGYRLGAGLMLDMRFARNLSLPSLEYPYRPASIELPRLPVNAQFTGGLFRDFGRYSLGMDVIYRLPDKKGIEVGRDMAIHTSRTSFFLNLSYRLGGK